jgi:hypothetical protein
MRSLGGWLFVLLLVMALAPQSASARLFRRARSTSYNTYSYNTTSTSSTSVSNSEVATAQGVANIMARTGSVGHWGGNPGYEGCGSGSSAQSAYSNCCYANSGMATVDVGYAQGRNGMWFCCRRYR